MKKNNSIAFVAGRSGGHLLPAIALAKDAKQNSKHVIFFSTATTLDQTIAKQHSCIDTLIQLNLSNIPSRKPWLLPCFVWQCWRAFYRSYLVLKKEQPAKLISMGGYISVPVCIAARMLHIPIELYELNATPGKASSWLSKLADRINVCFKQAEKFFPRNKTIYVNYPLQYGTRDLNNCNAAEIKKSLHICQEKKVLFILGGSQGSHFINRLFINLLRSNTSLQNIFLIHQTGIDDISSVKKQYADLSVENYVFAYEQNLLPYYCIADLVITRAGAGSLFELAFFKKRSIIIPLEIKSTDHQLYNASAMREEYPDLFTVIRQSDLISQSIRLQDYIRKEINQDVGQLSGLAPSANV